MSEQGDRLHLLERCWLIYKDDGRGDIIVRGEPGAPDAQSELATEVEYVRADNHQTAGMGAVAHDPQDEVQRRSLRQTIVDWRARALDAEAEVARLRARLGGG